MDYIFITEKRRNKKMHPNSLANLRPKHFTKENAAFYGRKGGLKSTPRKKIFLLAHNLQKRKCLSCDFFDICYNGQTEVWRVLKETNNQDEMMKVRCQLKSGDLNLLSLIYNSDFPELIKMMFSRMVVSAKNFKQISQVTKIIIKYMISMKRLDNLNNNTRTDQYRKIEVVWKNL